MSKVMCPLSQKSHWKLQEYDKIAHGRLELKQCHVLLVEAQHQRVHSAPGLSVQCQWQLFSKEEEEEMMMIIIHHFHCDNMFYKALAVKEAAMSNMLGKPDQ